MVVVQDGTDLPPRKSGIQHQTLLVCTARRLVFCPGWLIQYD